MDLSLFHFSHPLWLLAGLILPLVWGVYFLFHRKENTHHQLEMFIDKHLLPYLLINNVNKKNSLKSLVFWSLVWTCLTLALAGPRWSFREIDTYSPDQSLVILLDLSESMNAADVKPSRLIRAKQKIEDLLNLSKGVKIGLIAFAADPHMIAPLTDDKETIRHFLPFLTTNLVYVQGSRLSPALEMASSMLEAEPGDNKVILVISDGGFEDASAMVTAQKLAKKGIIIHAMGVGTSEGAPVSNEKTKAKTFSKLDKQRLHEISNLGNGHYLEAHYSDHDETVILNELAKRTESKLKEQKRQFWDEHFYLIILPVLPIILWWFRQKHLFATVLLLLLPIFNLEALEIQSYFKNSEEQGEEAFQKGDYEIASTLFQDPYRKGVACYKAENFAEAESLFRESYQAQKTTNAGYNLGNALAQQQKLEEAITAYEEVLKQQPDHVKSKENLELVKKMLEEQQQNQQQQDQNSQDSKGNKDQKDSDNKDQQKQQDKQDSDQQQKEQDENKNDQDKQDSKEEKPKQEQQKNQDSQDQQTEKAARSEEDVDADLWLNQIVSDPEQFLKNRFCIESKINETKEGLDPW